MNKIEKQTEFPSKWCENDIFLRYCKEVAGVLQVPLEFVVLPFLSSVAACIQGNTAVQVTEGWKEPVCLWTLCAAESGERKSPVFNEIMCDFFKSRLGKEKDVHFIEYFWDGNHFNQAGFREIALVMAEGYKSCCFACDGWSIGASFRRSKKNIERDAGIKMYSGDPFFINYRGQAKYIKEPRLSMVTFTLPAVLKENFNKLWFPYQCFIYYKKPRRKEPKVFTYDSISDDCKENKRKFYFDLLNREQESVYTLDDYSGRGVFHATLEDFERRIDKEKSKIVCKYLENGVSVILRLAAVLHTINNYGRSDMLNMEMTGREIETAKSLYDYYFQHFVSIVEEYKK